MRPLPPLDYLNEALSYDPIAGIFTWKVRPGHHFKTEARCKTWNSCFAGAEAGSTFPNGRIKIGLLGHTHYAHRLAWFVSCGELPQDQIDHIDGVPSNNALTNLREATNSENMCNRKLNLNSTSGAKGVSWSNGMRKWAVNVQSKGKQTNFGYFTDFDKAVEAANQARITLHGDFARHS